MNETTKQRTPGWLYALGVVGVLVLGWFALMAFLTGEWSVAIFDTAIIAAIVVQVRLRP